MVDNKPKVDTGKKKAAFEQIQEMGYNSYTVVGRFKLSRLDLDTRRFTTAKKINLLAIKEDDGKLAYLGLDCLGMFDEKLFLLAIRKDDLIESIEKAKPEEEGYVGLDFFGVNSGIGSVALVAMPYEAYQKFAAQVKGIN